MIHLYYENVLILIFDKKFLFSGYYYYYYYYHGRQFQTKFQACHLHLSKVDWNIYFIYTYSSNTRKCMYKRMVVYGVAEWLYAQHNL